MAETMLWNVIIITYTDTKHHIQPKPNGKYYVRKKRIKEIEKRHTRVAYHPSHIHNQNTKREIKKTLLLNTMYVLPYKIKSQ